jgi:predicted secreted hydrolase
LRNFLIMTTLVCLAVAVWADSPPALDSWLSAGKGYQWDFPRDDGIHPDYKTEWWYLTGHLFPTDETVTDQAALAFQMTFFRVGLQPPDQPLPDSNWAARDLVMAHASVADPGQNIHRFSEVLRRATPLLGGFGGPTDTTLAWCQGPAGTADKWRISRSGEGYRLQAADDRQGFRYDLTCVPAKPRVFHGDGGFSPKSADGSAASLYFSFTRMVVTGTVSIGEKSIPVRGQCWLDREIFSSSLAPDQTGWDWVSLQLEDGRDLMVYRLRGKNPTQDFALGTLVDDAGISRTLPAESFTLKPFETWTSPETGAEYPIGWKLEIPDEGIDLVLKATMPEQENISRQSGVHYWEGAVTAHPAGKPDQNAGRGFVELTGYGKGSRPPV